MDPRARSTLKWLAVLVSLAWMAWAGWDQFAALPDEAVQNHGSDAVKQRMDDCQGSFRQRYECKEAIIVQSGQDTFYNMVLRLSIVSGPPILLAVLFSLLVPKARIVVVEEHKESANSWKARAHGSVRVPPQPPAPKGRVEPTLGPAPDAPAPQRPAGGASWKQKAQHNLGGKPPGEG